MAGPGDSRLKAPNPRLALKRRAAVRAFLSDDGPGFGVRVVDPSAPAPMERAQAAYAAADRPNFNALAQLAHTKPRDVVNWLANMAKGAVRDPVGTLMPVPPTGKLMTRAARLKQARAQMAAQNSAEMRRVNEFLAEKRSAFDMGLQPPPSRTTPRRGYVTQPVGSEPAPGFVRLYRGANKNAVAVAPVDPARMSGHGRFRTGHRDGAWWSPKLDEAQHYANSYGKDGELLFIDVPENSLAAAQTNKSTFMFDKEARDKLGIRVSPYPGRSRGVDVFDAVEYPPEQLTVEQARAAGTHGPEQVPLPPYRFTRRGSGVDVDVQ